MERRSIHELKSLILNAGLSLDGCVKRQDLETRAAEAEAILRDLCAEVRENAQCPKI